MTEQLLKELNSMENKELEEISEKWECDKEVIKPVNTYDPKNMANSFNSFKGVIEMHTYPAPGLKDKNYFSEELEFHTQYNLSIFLVDNVDFWVNEDHLEKVTPDMFTAIKSSLKSRKIIRKNTTNSPEAKIIKFVLRYVSENAPDELYYKSDRQEICEMLPNIIIAWDKEQNNG